MNGFVTVLVIVCLKLGMEKEHIKKVLEIILLWLMDFVCNEKPYILFYKGLENRRKTR